MSTATILYVEDNDDNVYMLRRRLERAGFRVYLAADGLDGLAKARHFRPRLVIMDLILPRLDGWEATRRMKADPLTEAIPIIALSSSAMPEDRRRAVAAGCDEFASKPVDFEQLTATIHRLLGESGTNPETP